MNREYNNNINYININGYKFISQEELNKLRGHNEKFLACKCGKKPEFRWKKSEQSDSYGLFFGIIPYKGPNGEEVCHKCALCVKCGKEVCNSCENGFWRSEKTNDNPSGEWVLAYCSAECFNGEKPSLPKKEVKKCQGTVFTHHNGGYKSKHGSTQFLPCTNVVNEGDFCKLCKDQTETYQQVKVRIAAEEKQGFEKYKQAQAKSQSWWDTLSNSERERECERLVENMKLGKYWGNNVREGEGSGWACDGSLWMIENGKFTSHSPHLVPIQITEEFMKKEILVYHDEVGIIDFFESQMVKVKKDDSDNENPPLKIEEGERIGGKKLEIINNNKSNNEVLVIELKRIKKITLRNDNKLQIEFNSFQNNQNDSSGYLVNQIMTNEQVDNNQELQAVKNYLQKTSKDSLNQRELIEFFNSSSVSTETPKDISRLLKIGGGVILVFGLLGWLLVISKRKLKKH